jgi:hypothetical protein
MLRLKVKLTLVKLQMTKDVRKGELWEPHIEVT